MEELIQRCSWATTDLYKEYHDNEWGKPVHDENKLFEMLILEGMQAGLGNNYLDLREDPNGNLVELFVYVLGASLIILLLYCVALLDEQHERRKRGKTAEAEL